MARKQQCSLRWPRTGIFWRPLGPPFFAPLPLLCPPPGEVSTWIRLLLLSLFWVSSVRWLYVVGCIYLRGAVGSRPKPWTRLRCSESHWSNPVVLPVGQPGAPASSTSLPAWFVSWWTGIGDSAACLLCGWVVVRVWMHYIRLLCILQCTAGLSGTMTSWNVLNSSATGTFNEPAPTRATLPNVKLVWRNCYLQSCQSSAFFCCPSVESSHCLASCYLHDWRYFCMLFIFASIAYGWGVPLAELTHFAGLHFSPMKLGALHYLICDGCMEVFHWLAKLPMRHCRPPPLLGGTWHSDHHDILAHGEYMRRIYDSDSVHGGPLDKLIWEDAERGTVVAPWSCTASAHLCQSRQAKCLGLHVFLNVVVLNSFSHDFLRVMQWSNHCVLWQIFLVGVFVWAPAPFVCLVCCFSWRNASLAGGFAGRLAGLCVVWFVVICLHFRTVLVLVQIDVLRLMLM